MLRSGFGPLGVENVEIDPAGVGIDVDHSGARRDGDRNRDQHHVGPSVAGQIDTDDRFLGVVGRGDDLIGNVERRHDEVLADDRAEFQKGAQPDPADTGGADASVAHDDRDQQTRHDVGDRQPIPERTPCGDKTDDEDHPTDREVLPQEPHDITAWM